MSEFTPTLRAAFVKSLRAQCESEGISQRELAELSGIHAVTVNRIFSGSQNLTLDTAQSLAYSANLDPSDFFAS